MSVKMILSVPAKIMRTALMISRIRNETISELVIELIEQEAAKKNDPFKGLEGIWGDNPINAAQLRKRAWKRS